MAFKKGDPKPEGSGMKKGQKTKRSAEAIAIFDEHEFCPLEKVLEKLQKVIDDELYINTCLKLMKFKFPERKAIEHKFDPSNMDTSEILQETKKILTELEGKT